DTAPDSAVGVTKAVELATKASKWSQTYLGTPLSKLPLDPTTVTAGNRCATWRYHQRGGYSSLDDAGLRLRVSHPHLLRRLASSHVADLPLDLNKEARAKKEENKLVGEQAREVDEELKNTIDKLNADNEKKRKEFEDKERIVHTDVTGSNAAFRASSWRLVERTEVHVGINWCCQHRPETIRSLIDKENDSAANSRGNSPKKPFSNLNGLSHKLNGIESNIQQLRELLMCTGDISGCYVHGKGDFRPRWYVFHTEEQVTALIATLNKRGLRENELRNTLESEKSNVLQYIAKCPLYQLNPTAASDREAWRGTIMLRGYDKQADYLSWGPQQQYRDDYHLPDGVLKLPTACVQDREAWRGTIMLRGYDKQADYLSWGPQQQYRDDYHLPDGVLKLPTACVQDREAWRGTIMLRGYVKQADYLSWGPQQQYRDDYHLPDGVLKLPTACVQDREAWRGTIMLRGYDKQADYLSWGPQQQYRDDYHLPDGVLKLPTGPRGVARDHHAERLRQAGGLPVMGAAAAVPQRLPPARWHSEKSETPIAENKYRDPGHYLAPKINGVKIEGDTGAKADVVRGLVSALLQLEALARWEVSLMECRSFAQVVLHVLALDSSVAWSSSILHASCRICRRKADPDNMLLCDG
ncbi:putative zinc finger protein, partial [Operophtera brumata]